MAKRAQQAANAAPRVVQAGSAHLVVTRVADEVIGFHLEGVSEIIRVPHLARMPLAPASLLGLANLRGAVLPVVSLRRLLGLPDAPLDAAARIVVIAGPAAVGLAVDRVEAFADVAADRFSADRAGAGRLDPDILDGVVKGLEGAGTIKILNPAPLLRRTFERIAAPAAAPSVAIPSGPVRTAAEAERRTALVSFDLGAQEYALPLDRVREIVQVPGAVAAIAGSEAAVLGVVTLRDRLLPLVSLRALLGLPQREGGDADGKVIVVSIGNGSVGVVADRTREILRIDPTLIDPAPALLTRGAGDAEIESICRLDGGTRLVGILSPDRLFRSDLVRRVLADAGNDNAERAAAEIDMTDEQFIVFRLGAQDYGLPIAAVAEIAKVPEQIARVPKAPAFIDGVINLRGTVLPVMDLRRRFDLASDAAASGRRILVVAAGGAQAGFIVDSVSEVLKVSATDIRSAPELSKEQMRLIGRVVNLKARMILLIDPAQLLTEGEASAVAALAQAEPLAAPTAS
jgi:purine-binding chemotaxis protein CheW